jgi:hypothetical protein
MTGGKNVTIILHSSTPADVKTVSLSASTGNLFTVSSGITLKLEHIILKGSSANDKSLIRIASGGTLVMNTGSEITGNKNGSMYESGLGGAISVDSGGTVTMLDGKITKNRGLKGGGIAIQSGGTGTMHGGTISGNTVPIWGGGIFVNNGGRFIKTSLNPGGTSGIIYGSDVGDDLANTSTGNNGTIGAAVYYDGSNKKRNTTLGGYDEISTDNVNIGWE